MSDTEDRWAARRNVRLYPWFKFFQNLLFWQAIWFLFFEARLSAAEAIVMYAVYDLVTTVLEVPSGYLSDRFGRRRTLLVSAGAGALAMVCVLGGDGFAVFALAQALLGMQVALASGTDNAILFESLAADGRAEDVEDEELRAYRATFAGLALSAVTGGAMALWSFPAAFAATALAFLAAVAIVAAMSEPPRHRDTPVTEAMRLAALRRAFRRPVLVWLFALGVLMYGYSHVPFVFGQPYIREALGPLGLAAEAPLVSGFVTAVMMALSMAVTLIAARLRRRIGLAAMLCLAFAMQVGLAAALAATNAAQAIVLLVLRMVPSSLSTPFIVARIQPLLGDEARATFLSVKSLAGRLVFAGSLWVASWQASADGPLGHDEMRIVLGWYAGVGVLALAILAVTAWRVGLEPARPASKDDSAP